MTAPKAFPRVALDLATTVERIQQNFVICDPNLPDCPIVFASDGFIELTEYPRHEILGRNCRSECISQHTCCISQKGIYSVHHQHMIQIRPACWSCIHVFQLSLTRYCTWIHCCQQHVSLSKITVTCTHTSCLFYHTNLIWYLGLAQVKSINQSCKSGLQKALSNAVLIHMW